LDGWFSNSTVLWVNASAYLPYADIPNDTPPDIEATLKDVFYCADSYTCYYPDYLLTDKLAVNSNIEFACLFPSFCFVIKPKEAITDRVVCLTYESGPFCMTARETVDNSTIEFNDYVIWYEGVAYDTLTYLPEETSGDVTYASTDVIHCLGKYLCYYNVMEDSTAVAGEADVFCYETKCFRGELFPVPEAWCLTDEKEVTNCF